MIKLCVSFVVLCLLAGTAQGQADRAQTRSMVISQAGIVAAEHPLAAQAGALMLAEGGSAIDAAVAVNAVMGIVAPMLNGIGGDLFAIVFDPKTDKLYGLNASGWSPADLTLAKLSERGSSMSANGINAVTVPGAVDGWAKLLERFGRKHFADVLSPAIDVSERGFPVSEIFAEAWADSANLRPNTNGYRTFSIDGKAPWAADKPCFGTSLQASIMAPLTHARTERLSLSWRGSQACND